MWCGIVFTAIADHQQLYLHVKWIVSSRHFAKYKIITSEKVICILSSNASVIPAIINNHCAESGRTDARISKYLSNPSARPSFPDTKKQK
jgi:hypothetical protein